MVYTKWGSTELARQLYTPPASGAWLAWCLAHNVAPPRTMTLFLFIFYPAQIVYFLGIGWNFCSSFDLWICWLLITATNDKSLILYYTGSSIFLEWSFWHGFWYLTIEIKWEVIQVWHFLLIFLCLIMKVEKFINNDIFSINKRIWHILENLEYNFQTCL